MPPELSADERQRIYLEEKARLEARRRFSGSPFMIAAIVTALLSLVIMPVLLAPLALIFSAFAIGRHERDGWTALYLSLIAVGIFAYQWYQTLGPLLLR